MTLLELDPERVQEDVATHLAFCCLSCHYVTVFPSSQFSPDTPANYSVNKDLAVRLGNESFQTVTAFVQETKIEGFMKMNVGSKIQFAQLLDANLQRKTTLNGIEKQPVTNGFPQGPRRDDNNQPEKNLQPVTLKQIHATKQETSVSPNIMKNINLPPQYGDFAPNGCRLISLPPGTRIAGKIVKTTPQECGIPAGVYQVVDQTGPIQRFLAVQGHSGPTPITITPPHRSLVSILRPIHSTLPVSSKVVKILVRNQRGQVREIMVPQGNEEHVSIPKEEAHDETNEENFLDPTEFLEQNSMEIP